MESSPGQWLAWWGWAARYADLPSVSGLDDAVRYADDVPSVGRFDDAERYLDVESRTYIQRMGGEPDRVYVYARDVEPSARPMDVGGTGRAVRDVEWNPHSKRWHATADVEVGGKVYKKGQFVPGGPPDRARMRVVKPIEGLYESIPADLDDALPPGWKIVEEYHTPLDDPRIRFIETKIEYVDPETGKVARGRFQRMYSPEEGTLTLKAAFLQDPQAEAVHRLPAWIEAGESLVPGRGTPTATFFTLYQMKKLGIPYGGLERVRWSDVINRRTLLHLEWLKRRYPNTPLEELIARTHSVRYASTALTQSGHEIVPGSFEVKITGSEEQIPIDSLKSDPDYSLLKQYYDELDTLTVRVLDIEARLRR